MQHGLFIRKRSLISKKHTLPKANINNYKIIFCISQELTWAVFLYSKQILFGGVFFNLLVKKHQGNFTF